MGLVGDRAEGHGPGGEAFHDFGGGFNFAEWDRLGKYIEFEEAARVRDQINELKERVLKR